MSLRRRANVTESAAAHDIRLQAEVQDMKLGGRPVYQVRYRRVRPYLRRQTDGDSLRRVVTLHMHSKVLSVPLSIIPRSANAAATKMTSWPTRFYFHAASFRALFRHRLFDVLCRIWQCGIQSFMTGRNDQKRIFHKESLAPGAQHGLVT